MCQLFGELDVILRTEIRTNSIEIQVFCNYYLETKFGQNNLQFMRTKNHPSALALSADFLSISLSSYAAHLPILRGYDV
jgi:hypothetical protein